MKTYVYERERMKDGTSMITRYELGEYFWVSVVKFLAFIFLLWTLELVFWFVIYPAFWLCVIAVKFLLRCVWWLIKLPFCLLFKKRLPLFWGDDDD